VARKSNNAKLSNPTAAELAGIPVCIEESPTMQVRTRRGAKARSRTSKNVNPAPAAMPKGPPTAADLAGIPVCVENEEDLTIRPRKKRTRKLDRG
jgi:hypothetical protein